MSMSHAQRFFSGTSRNFRQLFIRREIQLVKGHNKYATPSTGFQSAYFAMKKSVGFQPLEKKHLIPVFTTITPWA